MQLMHSGWDQHGNLFTQLENQCKDTEGPSAALVKDLKERGMLDDTLVIWGGEFGRTPFGQGDPANPKGRDHFGKSFSWWMAGAVSNRVAFMAPPMISDGTSSKIPFMFMICRRPFFTFVESIILS